MTSLRRMCCDDLLRFSNVNLDAWTETYNFSFYMVYMSRWPELLTFARSASGRPMGYMMGKVEGNVAEQKWHGHVTAVTVAPEFRRVGLARQLMGLLEAQSERIHNAFFVDLFVRASNAAALAMYAALGYSEYRRVLEYYSGEEDALDLRKALPRDIDRRSIIPLPHPVRPDDETD